MTQIDELDKVMDQAKQVVQDAIPPTVIFFLLDESSSMTPVREATILGVNEFLAEQASQPGLAYFSLTKFASKADVMGDPVEIGQFPPIDLTVYKPNGNTALYDAIGVTVERAEEWLGKVQNLTSVWPEMKLKYQVLFVIQTDGHENNSSDHTAESIRKLISKKTEDKWDFVFLGADQDAILAAGALGIAANMTATYAGTKAGTKSAIAATSHSVSMYRASGRDAVLDSSFYNSQTIEE